MIASWLREKLGCPRRDVFSEAIAATDEVTIHARSLRQQLEPFRFASDPFSAMAASRQMSDEFEKRQEAEIYRGPSS